MTTSRWRGLQAVAVVLIAWRANPIDALSETEKTIDGEESRPAELHIAGLPWAVRLAVLSARHRLERGRCREIFSEFSDSAGRPLQARLDDLGQDGRSYLDWIRFEDGDGYGRCRLPHVFAFTVPEGRVVFICGQKFRQHQPDVAHLTLTILHEELHSLGLAENPPSSDEINRRVASRCL